MGDNEEGNLRKISDEFDIKSELSALVESNVISPRIAEKLVKKLKEKNVKLTKEQLNALVRKINDIIRSHARFDIQTPKTPIQTGQSKSDLNMQKLIETVEKLEFRLNAIENDLKIGDKKLKKISSSIVKTEDIKIPETMVSQDWKIEPLSQIPNDPDSIIILMKWLQYLIDKCGRSNLPNILDYYVDIGWITQDVKISLMDYSQGITEETKGGDSFASKTINQLPARDHIQSFIYIQKLKGLEIDRHFIEKIDDELSRLTKKLDSYYLKQ